MILQNYFLVAMRGLNDLNFKHAVVYICAHNEDGSMGVVINQPIMDVSLGEVLEQMNIEVTHPEVNQLPVCVFIPTLLH